MGSTSGNTSPASIGALAVGSATGTQDQDKASQPSGDSSKRSSRDVSPVFGAMSKGHQCNTGATEQDEPGTSSGSSHEAGTLPSAIDPTVAFLLQQQQQFMTTIFQKQEEQQQQFLRRQEQKDLEHREFLATLIANRNGGNNGADGNHRTANTRKPDCPDFTGDGNEPEERDFRLWYRRFTELMPIYNYTPENELVWLKQLMKGAAKKILDGCPEAVRNDRDALIEEMSKRFKDASSVTAKYRACFDRHQGKTESVETYYSDLRYKVRSANAEQPITEESLLKHVFLSGLLPHLREKIAPGVKDEHTVDNVVEQAVCHQNSQKELQPTKVQLIEEEVNAVSTAPESSNPGMQSKRVCWYCQRHGHTAQYCDFIPPFNVRNGWRKGNTGHSKFSQNGQQNDRYSGNNGFQRWKKTSQKSTSNEGLPMSSSKDYSKEKKPAKESSTSQQGLATVKENLPDERETQIDPQNEEIQSIGPNVPETVNLEIGVLSRETGNSSLKQICINGQQKIALFDSGSAVNLISQNTWNQLTGQQPSLSSKLNTREKANLVQADNRPIGATQIGQVPLDIATRNGLLHAEEIIFIVMTDLTYDVIIGRTAMEKLGIILAMKAETEGWQPLSDDLKLIAAVAENEKSIGEKEELGLRWKNLQPLLEIRSELNDEQKGQTERLLQKYADLFALDSKELIGTNVAEHRIVLSDTRPVKMNPRRVAENEQKIVEEEIKKMLDMGVIQPSSSPYRSSIVLVRKKNGEVRFCIDFRELNKRTVQDEYPLPRISDLTSKLKDAEYFSSLDLASGYWQIPMQKESQDKTAFITHSGQYEFKRMPFGLCSAPATFQRAMNQVLALLLRGPNPPVMVYLDDILVKSATFEDHLENLDAVLTLLQEANLKLKPTKCKFIDSAVEYLGHHASKAGLEPSRIKKKLLMDQPVPETKKQLHSFMGLAGYFQRFIRNYATTAKPLSSLLKKNVKFLWKMEQQKAWEQIKQDLAEADLLKFPDFTHRAGKFVLATDASNVGIGAVLWQEQLNGERQLIECASKTLNDAERNYSTTHREALAVVWAIKKFRYYLWGRQFKIETDHASVKGLLLSTMLAENSRVNRWRMDLQEYNFEIQYIPGKTNLIPDTLSRLPDENEEIMEEKIAGIAVQDMEILDWSKWHQAQKNDLDCKKFKQECLQRLENEKIESGLREDDEGRCQFAEIAGGRSVVKREGAKDV